jgi:hypothetical protein
MRMHRLSPPLLLAVILVSGGGTAGPARAETRVGGTLRSDAVWTREGSPYIVTGDVIVPKAVTLTIDPGVTVRFKADIASREGLNLSDLEILVRGTLVVAGAAGDTVYLTSDAPDPRWTDWQGIIADGPDALVDLDAVIVEYANEGIKCLQGTVNAKNTTVRNCNFKGIYLIEGRANLQNVLLSSIGNEGGTGTGVSVDRGSTLNMSGSFAVGVQNGLIFARGSTGTIENTVVSNCASRGVVIRKSNPQFTNCTITQNQYGFMISAGAAPRIHHNNIFDNVVLDVELSEYREETRLDLSNNWWGEAHLGLIEERIGDALDDAKVKVFAIIEPVLTEATTLQGKTRKQ